jgi:hypothetical protein
MLSGYHHYLVFLNETTNENLKKTFILTGNPYRKSCCEHILEIFRPRQKGMLWKPKRGAGESLGFTVGINAMRHGADTSRALQYRVGEDDHV